MPSKLLGDNAIPQEARDRMKRRGGTWFAYQNAELYSGPRSGHLQFLRCGPDASIKYPPLRLPDTATAINWRYVLVGKVNLESGTIEDI